MSDTNAKSKPAILKFVYQKTFPEKVVQELIAVEYK